MKTIISEKGILFEKAALQLKALVDKKPDAVLALSGSEQLFPFFECLCALCDKGELSLAHCRIFLAAEFSDAPYELSFANVLRERLIDKTDASAENFYCPREEALEDYEDLISESGGIDLAIPHLGDNAQLAFNEPSTQFSSRSRVQKLSPASRREYAAWFGSEELVPEKAVTMGIGTLCDAREIIVIAHGDGKAEAVFKMLYGRNDSVVPAAFLQIPLNVSLYLDEQASSQL